MISSCAKIAVPTLLFLLTTSVAIAAQSAIIRVDEACGYMRHSDRLRRMGEPCACWGNGSAGIPECDRASRTRRSGCVRNRRCCAGRTGSIEAASRESLSCGRVGKSTERLEKSVEEVESL